MGSWRLQGRERVVVPTLAFVVAFAAAGAWRLGVLDSGSDGGGVGDDPAQLATTSSDGRADGPTLAEATYEAGDCVVWDAEGSGQVDTDVVPCTEEHLIEMTEPVLLEDQDAYPREEEWAMLNQTRCGPAAERFLGVPLDPYGQFYADSIVPYEDAWASGDRMMWCGISWAGPRDVSENELFAAEMRGADQEYHYPVGSCVAQPNDAAPVIVPCTKGHHMEIVGELDLSDRPEIPTGAQERGLFDACAAQARTYLGADPAAPWLTGMETMTPESWAAGSRWVHCFLGQWDADDEQIELTGSAKG